MGIVGDDLACPYYFNISNSLSYRSSETNGLKLTSLIRESNALTVILRRRNRIPGPPLTLQLPPFWPTCSRSPRKNEFKRTSLFRKPRSLPSNYRYPYSRIVG